MAEGKGRQAHWCGARGREEQSAALLVRDGRTPLAHTDPHGTWLHWLG